MELTEGACKAFDLQRIKVNPTPVADYFASEEEGCAGLEVSFLENATNGITYVWDFGDGTEILNLANPIHAFTSPGSFPVKLTVYGAGGCKDEITKSVINISGGPSASFSSTPDPIAGEILYMPNAEVTFLNQSENASNFLWDFGDGNYSSEENPIHNYEQPGMYYVTLTATDGKGCVAVDSLGIYDVRVPGLVIPNIFTPNGDGFNDEFQVVYEGGENYQLKVFDRWGRPYFETTSPNEFWKGTSQNGSDASEGVYFYSVQVGEKGYTGNVTLLR